MATQFNQPRTQYDEEQGYQRHLAYLRAQSKNSQGFQDSLRNIALGNEPTADAPRTADEILGDESEVNRRAQSILGKIFTDKPRAQYDPLGAETQEQFEMRAKPSTFLINTMPHAMKVLLITEAPSILAELKNKAFLTVPTFVNYMHHYRAAYEESGGTSKYNTNNKLLGDITALIDTLPTHDTIGELKRMITRVSTNSTGEMKRAIKHVSDKLSILQRGIPSKAELAQVAASVSKGTMDIMQRQDQSRRGLMSQAYAYETAAKNRSTQFDDSRQRDMQYLDNQSLATKTILDRLETLLQNVPTEADLTAKLIQLETILTRTESDMKAGITNANTGIAELKSWVETITDDLGTITVKTINEIIGFLGEIKNDTSETAQFISDMTDQQKEKLVESYAKVYRAEAKQELKDSAKAQGKKPTGGLTKAQEQEIQTLAEMAADESFRLQEGKSVLQQRTSSKMAIAQPIQRSSQSSQSQSQSQSQSEPTTPIYANASDVFGYGLNRKRIDPRHVRFVGRGIALEAEPKKYYEFGKYMISIPHLGNNILKVKYLQNGNEVPSFNSQKISDDLTDFIEDLVDTGKINERHLNKLEAPEKRLFSKLINQSGLYGKFKIRVLKNPNDKAEEDRFELVKGEFIAGNDNPAIVKELKHLIIKFMTEGRIPKNQGHELLFQLSV